MTFIFVDRSDVLVFVNGAQTQAYTWTSQGLIQLNTAPAAGVPVVLMRRSIADTGSVNFTGGIPTPSFLNNAFRKILFIAQEAFDSAKAALGRNVGTGQWDAASSRLTNLLDPTAGTDAANKEYVDGRDATTLAAIQALAGSVPGVVSSVGASTGKILSYDTASLKYKPVYATVASAHADLRDFMDIRYGVDAWTQRTGVGQGSDIGPAINDALDAIRARYGTGGTVFIPPGLWMMNTGVDHTKLSGNRIEGAHPLASKVVYGQGSGAAFYWSGRNVAAAQTLQPGYGTGTADSPQAGYGGVPTGYSGGGIKHLGILLESGLGLSNATAILLQGDSCDQPDQFEMEDLYISSITPVNNGSFWFTGVQIYGVARTHPQGVRIGTIKDVQQFACHNAAFNFFNLVGWTVENIGTYVGAESFAGSNSAYTGKTGMNININGGGDATTNTTLLHIRGMNCNGTLNMSNSQKVHVQGFAAAATAAATALYYAGDLYAGGFFTGAFGTDSPITLF